MLHGFQSVFDGSLIRVRRVFHGLDQCDTMFREA